MTIDALINLPARTQTESVFSNNADNIWPQLNTFGSQVNAAGVAIVAIQADVIAKQILADTSASTATAQANLATAQAAAAAALTSALPHNPATNYTLAQPAISNVNFLAYRRKSAGSSATDPADDPTIWASTSDALSVGGASVTGNLTLIKTSPAAMTINVTTMNKSVTLPDATTMTKGTALFNFYNNSNVFYGIKNSAGVTLGWVEPYTNVIAHLSDNSTANGVWSFDGISHIGVTAQFINTASAMGGNLLSRCMIDADKEAFTFHGIANTYVVIYNHTTGVWGTPVQVVAVMCKASVTSNGSNKLFVCYGNSSTLYIVPFTISGESLAPTTGANLATGGTSYTGAIAYLNNSVVVGFYDGVNSQVVGINVTSTPTFGTPQNISTYVYTPNNIFVYGTNVVVAQLDRVAAFAVSGSTLTVGAAFGVGYQDTCHTSQLSSGNLLVVDTTGASLYKMTGSTLTRSQSTFSSSAGNISAVKLNDKVVVMWSDAAYKTNYRSYSDNAGSILASTLYQVANVTDVGKAISLVSANKNAATFYVESAYKSSTGTERSQQLITINVVSNEPVIINTQAVNQEASTSPNKYNNSAILNKKTPNSRILFNENYGRYVGDGGREFDIELKNNCASSIKSYLGGACVAHENALGTTFTTESFVKGSTDAIGYFATNLIGRCGVVINRIEVA